MISSVQDLAFLAGIILGAGLLMAVGWIWLRKQVLGVNGVALAVIGFALTGLSFWRSISFEATEDGVKAAFERIEAIESRVDAVDVQVEQVAGTSLQFSTQLTELQSSVATTNSRFQALTTELTRTNALSGNVSNELSRGLIVPQIDGATIERRERALETIINQ